VRVKQTAVDMI